MSEEKLSSPPPSLPMPSISSGSGVPSARGYAVAGGELAVVRACAGRGDADIGEHDWSRAGLVSISAMPREIAPRDARKLPAPEAAQRVQERGRPRPPDRLPARCELRASVVGELVQTAPRRASQLEPAPDRRQVVGDEPAAHPDAAATWLRTPASSSSTGDGRGQPPDLLFDRRMKRRRDRIPDRNPCSSWSAVPRPRTRRAGHVAGRSARRATSSSAARKNGAPGNCQATSPADEGREHQGKEAGPIIAAMPSTAPLAPCSSPCSADRPVASSAPARKDPPGPTARRSGMPTRNTAPVGANPVDEQSRTRRTRDRSAAYDARRAVRHSGPTSAPCTIAGAHADERQRQPDRALLPAVTEARVQDEDRGSTACARLLRNAMLASR